MNARTVAAIQWQGEWLRDPVGRVAVQARFDYGSHAGISTLLLMNGLIWRAADSGRVGRHPGGESAG
jgi:hypothetical protein